MSFRAFGKEFTLGNSVAELSLGLGPAAWERLQQWGNRWRGDRGPRLAGLLLAAAAAWALWMDLAQRIAEWCRA